MHAQWKLAVPVPRKVQRDMHFFYWPAPLVPAYPKFFYRRDRQAADSLVRSNSGPGAAAEKCKKMQK